MTKARLHTSLILAAGLLAITGAAAAQGLSERSKPPAVMINDKFAVAQGSWKPMPAEATRAEAALKAYVAMDTVASQWADQTPESPGESRLRHALGPKLDTYWLRATGVTGRQDELAAKIDNKPIVRLDGFCKVSGDVWKDDNFVINEGGGDCYFHAEYDLAGKAIVFFEVNRP